MLFRPLQSLYLALSLAVASKVVNGATIPARSRRSFADDVTQTVTVQRFHIRDADYGETSADVMQKLARAMSDFKASHRENVQRAYVGLTNDSTSTPTAQQIFLWKNVASPGDSPADTILPFSNFSATETVNSTTVLASNASILAISLSFPAVEITMADIVPSVNTSKVKEDFLNLVNVTNTSGVGFSGSGGIHICVGGRTFVQITGWASVETPTDLVSTLSPDSQASLSAGLEDFEGGDSSSLILPMREVP